MTITSTIFTNLLPYLAFSSLCTPTKLSAEKYVFRCTSKFTHSCLVLFVYIFCVYISAPLHVSRSKNMLFAKSLEVRHSHSRFAEAGVVLSVIVTSKLACKIG